MSNFKTGDFCFVKDLGIAKWPCRVVESQGDSITISYIDPAGSWNNRRSSVDISLVTAYNGEKTGGGKPHLQKAYKAIYKVGAICFQVVYCILKQENAQH